MTVYGKEIDFKITRLSDAGRMDKALKNMAEKEKEMQRTKELIPALTKGIRMFQDFFLEATGEDVLEECEDFEEARDAYLEFLNQIKEQKQQAIKIPLDMIK